LLCRHPLFMRVGGISRAYPIESLLDAGK
jgi:hypothetical protein